MHIYSAGVWLESIAESKYSTMFHVAHVRKNSVPESSYVMINNAYM